jgi:serine/threonine protein kinase
MVSKTSCPAAADLKRLLDGNLPDAEQTGVSGHLDSCPDCQQLLQELAADHGAWDAVAGHLRSEKNERREPLQQAMNQLRGLHLSLPTHFGVEEGEEDPLTFLAPPVKPRQLGKLDQYEIIEIIGRGGMGIVFKALDPDLHRIVAIKVMAPQLAAVPSARGRFLREARATAAVCHEHVITIHAVEPKRLPYLVMQFVSGVSLQDRLEKRGALQLEEILRIGMQIAQGLAAAHAQGLVHRDIKPANILLENGVERVKITDFGLARAASDARLTQSGVIVGTPQYMAPEQASGEEVDHRADLFSLGSVLYFMCTGRPPFEGVSTLAVIRRVCEEKAEPIQEINPNIPAWLGDIISRLQAKNPDERFQSAAEVADLLNRHLLELQRNQSTPASSRGINTVCSESGALPLALPVEATPVQIKGRRGKRLALIATLGLLACIGAMPFVFRWAFPRSSLPSDPQSALSNLHGQAWPENKHSAGPNHEQLAGARDNEETDDVTPAPIPNIPPPRLNGKPVEVRLAEKFTQVRTGGGGRYLVFHLKKTKKLAIFDVSALEVVMKIDLESENVVYACGREKLIVVLPANRIIQRYDLTTFSCEATKPVPGEDPVLKAVMGCNSRGPLLLWTGSEVVFFDIERMERLPVEGALRNGHPQNGMELRVSADGQTFVGWTPGIIGGQYSVMHYVKRNAVITHSARDRDYNGHWTLPGADASLFFHSGDQFLPSSGLYSGNGFYSANLKSLASDEFEHEVLLPTEDRRFFLALRRQPTAKDEVSICTTAERRRVLTIRDVEKMTSAKAPTLWGLIEGEPRIHYLHSATVLLTLPEENDRVVVRPLDLFASVDPEGRNNLFVLSVPPRRVRAGKVYEHALEIHSTAGAIHYDVDGPPSMTISTKGKLSWKVPANHKRETVAVIVTIGDASGKDIKYHFDISVE